MTEELKTCNCKKKCVKVLKKFIFLSGAVFVGSTLAILLSAAILRPKCPPCPRGMMGPHPRMERQLPPPPPMMRDRGGNDIERFRGPDPRLHRRHMDYRGPQGDQSPEFNRQHRPEHPNFKKHSDSNPVKAPVPDKSK